MVITKPIICVHCFSPAFTIIKTLFACNISCWYLADVTAAQLHLPNINMIQEIKSIFWQKLKCQRKIDQQSLVINTPTHWVKCSPLPPGGDASSMAVPAYTPAAALYPGLTAAATAARPLATPYPLSTLSSPGAGGVSTPVAQPVVTSLAATTTPSYMMTAQGTKMAMAGQYMAPSKLAFCLRMLAPNFPFIS